MSAQLSSQVIGSDNVFGAFCLDVSILTGCQLLAGELKATEMRCRQPCLSRVLFPSRAPGALSEIRANGLGQVLATQITMSPDLFGG